VTRRRLFIEDAKGDALGLRTWEEFCGLEGETFKRIQNRRTFRVERHGRGYFIKCHDGVGWREIWKNLLNLKLPVLGAENEWRAIHRLHAIGVPTMQAVACLTEGWNPARLRSVLVTEALEGCISLERHLRDTPPDPKARRTLIHELARIARTLHDNGVNHRDFYLCHFLISQPWDGRAGSLRLFLIDLHRVQMRRSIPERWAVKDLGSLWFSALEFRPRQRELLRFLRLYRQRPLKQVLAEEGRFWQKVARRAQALDRTRPPAVGNEA
jgi:heptose I phosphotransferase